MFANSVVFVHCVAGGLCRCKLSVQVVHIARWYIYLRQHGLLVYISFDKIFYCDVKAVIIFFLTSGYSVDL